MLYQFSFYIFSQLLLFSVFPLSYFLPFFFPFPFLSGLLVLFLPCLVRGGAGVDCNWGFPPDARKENSYSRIVRVSRSKRAILLAPMTHQVAILISPSPGPVRSTFWNELHPFVFAALIFTKLVTGPSERPLCPLLGPYPGLLPLSTTSTDCCPSCTITLTGLPVMPICDNSVRLPSCRLYSRTLLSTRTFQVGHFEH